MTLLQTSKIKQQIAVFVVCFIGLSVVGCTPFDRQPVGRDLVTSPRRFRTVDPSVKSTGLDPRARDIERSLGVQ